MSEYYLRPIVLMSFYKINEDEDNSVRLKTNLNWLSVKLSHSFNWTCNKKLTLSH